MERNFSNIPKDKEKPERALNRKTPAQLSQKCFLSQRVTEIHYEPSTFIAAKRPEQMNSEDSPFYLAVNLTKMANSSKPWFKATPMGVNKLNSLMKTMAQKAGLNAENLTNHSGRKRMIQKLNDQEVPPTHIMQISGHKNVQSLNNYSSLFRETTAKHLQHLEQYHFN